jgi:hypothetical protein
MGYQGVEEGRVIGNSRGGEELSYNRDLLIGRPEKLASNSSSLIGKE